MAIDLFLNKDPNDVYKIENDTVLSVKRNSYEIQERIGSGGNAVVHKATDFAGEEYAIKFQLTLSRKMSARFQRELELLRATEHEHLIKYIDHGTARVTRIYRKDRSQTNIPFIVMPLADTTLMELVQTRKNIMFAEYMPQFRGLAMALQALHEKALHRDIKPENILVKGNTWLLSDLGLCKFIDAGEDMDITGKYEHIGPRYWMSPESINQIYGNADEISPISDIFQLGSVFWFVVTGRHPAGVVTEDDWNGPTQIFSPIYRSLLHDSSKRISNGKELHDALLEAVLTE